MSSNYPVSKACPQCGGNEYTKLKPDRFVAFVKDRVCKKCRTRYTPPTPVWAGIVFMLIGLLLMGGGTISLFLRVVSENPNPLSIPAMVCEGFLFFVGGFAFCQGILAVVRRGKV